jgi:hypothetical protein
MNNYYEQYMDCNAEMYKKISDKVINGEDITDKEFFFMVTFKKELNKLEKRKRKEDILSSIRNALSPKKEDKK